ncbi:hypothetical protein GF361_00260, partial [Candidatus Woesearchaeota archaeon]|nr:hypothetical protein [Candidatus Woesearchaeota archaeon]
MNKKIIIISILLVLLSCSVYAAHNPDFQEGFTYTSWWNNDYLQSTSDTSLNYLEDTGTDHVAVLVTWYMDDLTSTDIYQDGTKTPSDSAVVEAIEDVHGKGMKVMLKPHVDIKTYEWRGDINPSNWNTWFNNYETFINHYADIAEANNVEQFVVGTELKSSTSRTSDWQNVISGVRSRYNGNITYAANWDNYGNVNFWGDLDYIGVNAYFPLTGKTNPTLTELKNAWADEKSALSSFSSSKGKQIIFTEIGYQSRDGTNIEPWWREGSSDEQEQADCYRAALEVFWNETWLEGMYWWMWYWKYYEDPDDFSVYGKLAEDVVEEFYCDEDWQVHYGSCLTNDSRLKYYTDANNCGKTDDLPADNGTYAACDYCTEDVQGPFTTSCNISDEQIEYYVDNDYDSCCAVTGLSSDCSIDNGSYDNQTVSCDYCVPDWVEVIEECQPDDTYIGWYNDTNDCYAQTGLESDNNPPDNNTYVCDYCTPNMTYTNWSGWYDITGCRANDTILQERNRTEYDSNSCGEVNDTIHYEYQEINCDYCTPNIVNTSWSLWSNE